VSRFENLGASPELTEALAAEGIEEPTPLQESALPILAKGNNLVLEAGPGSGLLVAWSVPLIERIGAGGEGAKILVACATPETAERLAESVARLTAVTGHSVAALGSPWVSAERADIVFGAAPELVEALSAGAVSAGAVQAVVFDQAQLLETFSDLGGVERILDYVPAEAQRVLSALPMSPAVSDLVSRLFKRTMSVPGPADTPPRRGEIRFRIAPEPREAAALAVVDELLSTGARHVLVYCRSADRAADVGDYLTMHGFTAGAPGDADAPVWLGIDALEARSAAKGTERLAVVSCDAPSDPDMLDRRHSIGETGVVVVLPRELVQFKALGRRTGYETVPFPPQPVPNTPMARLRSSLQAAIEELDIAPYLLALEPLFERHGPEEVAAAAVALMRRGTPTGLSDAPPGPVGSAAARATVMPSWAKLFITVGHRDGLRVGDLLGAVTGEAGVPGDAVGKIDIHESHSIIEVHDTVAREVIQALNGTTIKHRAVRVDFDRPRKAAKKPRR